MESSPNHYQCPVYQTTDRAGALSTTGRSTNYLMAVHLPVVPSGFPDDQERTRQQMPAHWTLRGTALVLAKAP